MSNGGNTVLGFRLWITQKSDLYQGGTSTVSVYDPNALAGTDGAVSAPTQIYGPISPDLGMFLVRYSVCHDSTQEYLSIIRVDDPLGSPVFTSQFVPVGAIDDTTVGGTSYLHAPEPGTTATIDVRNRIALSAVWRDGYLYATAEVVPTAGPDSAQVTAHWWQISTADLDSLTIVMQGNVGGEDIAESTSTYFPSIAVTSEGYIGLGFGASGPSVYPGAYFAMRLPGDPIGYFGPADTVALGVAAYTPGSNSRWGDYSGMSIDPSDNTRLWAFNMYALSSSEYGTRWKSFSPSIINVPFDKPAIQTAIDASSPGAVIQVSPKTGGQAYNENLRLKSGVRVIGVSSPTRGLPVLAAPDTTAAVSYPDSAGGNTVFANFVLRGGGGEVVHLRGDGFLGDCLIDTTGATTPVGVFAESTGADARIQNCRIRVRNGSALKASYFAGAALDDTVEVLGSGLGLEAIGGSGIYSRVIADVADGVGFSFDGVGGPCRTPV